MIKAMFETVPLEITVINANDEVAGWNKHGTRLLIRPMTCMGLGFWNCHPPQSLSKIINQAPGKRSPGAKNHKTII